MSNVVIIVVQTKRIGRLQDAGGGRRGTLLWGGVVSDILCRRWTEMVSAAYCKGDKGIL